MDLVIKIVAHKRGGHYYTTYTIPDDDLLMQINLALAFEVVTWFLQFIPSSLLEGLLWYYNKLTSVSS